jgi:hypothetical protein
MTPWYRGAQDRGIIPTLAAIRTRSATESACILRISWPRCPFTVISLSLTHASSAVQHRELERMTRPNGRVEPRD